MKDNEKNLIEVNFEYKVSFEPTFNFYGFDLTDEVLKVIQEGQNLARTEPRKAIDRLPSLILQYPQVSILKQHLALAYQSLGEGEQARFWNTKLVQEHPNYLFGRLSLAADYLEKLNFQKVEDILGKHLELFILYPERKIFHVTEVLAFQRIAALYFIFSGDIQTAEKRLEVMSSLAPKHPTTLEIADRVRQEYARLRRLQK